MKTYDEMTGRRHVEHEDLPDAPPKPEPAPDKQERIKFDVDGNILKDKKMDRNDGEVTTFGVVLGILGFLLGAAIIISFLAYCIGCSNPHCPEGGECYVKRIPFFSEGGFVKEIAGPANTGASWRISMIAIDTRPRTYTEEFNVLAKDDLTVIFKFNAVLAVEHGRVKDIVEKFGGAQWYERYVQAPFRTYIRESVQEYGSADLKTQRDTIAKEVLVRLQDYLAKTPFKIVSLVVGDIHYPEVVTNAAANKMANAQLLQQKETEKLIATQDAAIRVEAAKGIAESQKIINSTLTANYLQHEAIEAQEKMANSSNHTTVYIPSGAGGIPLIKGVE